jgi:glycosyltransferase involved in cell wall biosynthesis
MLIAQVEKTKKFCFLESQQFMNILFVHRRYPGHFGKLAAEVLKNNNHKVVFLSQYLAGMVHPKVERLAFLPRKSATVPDTPAGNQELQEYLQIGQAVFETCQKLKAGGFIPDVIISHNGWGVMLYLRSIFPKARIIGHFEWYYNTYNSDVDFLAPRLATPEKAQKLLLRNMTILAGLAESDVAISPTNFQAAQFPVHLQSRFTVLHEGIDTSYYRPAVEKPRIIAGLDLSHASHLLVYATRGMEAYRGFPQFMRALPAVQQAYPALHTVIAGEDATYYGPRPASGRTWKEEMLAEVKGLDLTRIHFVGTLPKEEYLTLLQAADVHVYYTVPFVLSWSLLEAMACGGAIVASKTAPVEEVITDGVHGWLTPFFDIPKLSSTICTALDDTAERQKRGIAARQLVQERFEQQDCLQQWQKLITST